MWLMGFSVETISCDLHGFRKTSVRRRYYNITVTKAAIRQYIEKYHTRLNPYTHSNNKKILFTFGEFDGIDWFQKNWSFKIKYK